MYYSLIFIPIFILFCVNCEWVEIFQKYDKSFHKSSSLKDDSSYRVHKYRKNNSSNATLQTIESSKSSIENLPPKPKLIVSSTLQSKDTSKTTNTNSLKRKHFTTPTTTLNNDKNNLQKPIKVGNKTEDREERKSNNINGFVPFLLTVQEELLNSNRNFKKKETMLKNLGDKMFLNIDERINELWEREPSTTARKQKDDDYDMHFPSNEGALMTIGFLTFAVFLIKLVLKLIQALKDKQAMMVMMPSTMSRNNNSKKKREIEYNEQNKILILIEEYGKQ